MVDPHELGVIEEDHGKACEVYNLHQTRDSRQVKTECRVAGLPTIRHTKKKEARCIKTKDNSVRGETRERDKQTGRLEIERAEHAGPVRLAVWYNMRCCSVQPDEVRSESTSRLGALNNEAGPVQTKPTARTSYALDGEKNALPCSRNAGISWHESTTREAK